MVKKGIGIALAVLAAQVAWTATHTVVVSEARVYATELFGTGGSDIAVDYRGDPPTVTLQLQLSGTEADAVNNGHRAEITFALKNARFANNVRLSRLGYSAVVEGMTEDPTEVDVVGMSDGDRGDSSVTFRVEADADLPMASSTLSFAFEVPELTGLSGTSTKPVEATVTMGASGGSGWPDSADDGVEGDVALVTFRGALLLSVGGSGGRTEIPLEGGRMSFERPNRATLGTVTTGLTSAMACTSDDPIPADCILQADGDIFRLGRGDDGAGDMNISVTGDFRDGDMVWLDLDGDKTLDASERLRMDDLGSMIGAFDLGSVAGNANAAMGDRGEVDREDGQATKTLYYVPNGEAELRPSEFRASFSVDFDVDENEDKRPLTTFHNTMYALGPVGQAQPVEAMRSAPAMPSPEIGATEVGNLRIKCESATPCEVYLECDDASGQSWFAQLDEPIDGRATIRMTSADVAEALDFEAGEGWSDQLSCTILSSRDISVQVLTRTGNVLVNHTYWAND